MDITQESHSSTPSEQASSHQPQISWKDYLWSLDHKMIGKQYLVTSFLFLLLGGAMALFMRWQIAFPGTSLSFFGHLIPQPYAVDGVITPGFFNALVTQHATFMVFLVAMPVLIGAFGNFLIPLQIGARDMAFPLLNEISYWLYVLSGVIFCVAFFVPGGAANTGWTAYAPLSTVEVYNQVRWGQTLWVLGIFVNGLSSLSGAVNYVTTISNMRAPGMHKWRMPLFIWSLLVTSVIVLLAVPVLSAAGLMVIADLNFGTHFFTPYISGEGGQTILTGGQPLLWQHLFWFFGHPEVYIIVLPGMGLISEILPVFSRKPIFGYKAMAVAMAVIAFLGFLVWGHHMFVSGMNLVLSATFAASTIIIAVPSSIKTFNWLGTLWGGSIRFTVPMLNAISFISMFIIGGLTGIFMALAPVNLFIHNTYFIVAHFHYVIFGSSFFAMFAAIYFWYPKMFGRMMNQKLGVVHTVLTFIFFNGVFFPMHNVGLGGMMRRISDPTLFEHLRALQPINQFITISAIALGLSQLILLFNFFYSLRNGKRADKNPWESTTLEWTLPSPPVHGNYEKIPTVYNAPYEYGVPGAQRDFVRQDEDPATLPIKAQESLKKHAH